LIPVSEAHWYCFIVWGIREEDLMELYKRLFVTMNSEDRTEASSLWLLPL
jgi:hypothetical protein